MNVVKIVLGSLIAFFSYWLGGIDKAIEIIVFMMVADYATGLLWGIVSKSINSKIGIKGICKKVGYLILIAIATQLDILLNQNIRLVVIYGLIANEGLSIVENLGKIDVIVPAFIKKYFTQLQDSQQEKSQGK